MMITTERLTIRRICADDWKAIQGIWKDFAKSVYVRYDRPSAADDISVRKRIQSWASFAGSDEHMFFAVCLEGIVIGYAAFNKRDEAYELGYCFHSSYHHMGYAYESISALLSMMKERGTAVITAGTALMNVPSVNLLKTLGFQLAGTEELSFWKDEEGNDTVFEGGIFSLELR